MDTNERQDIDSKESDKEQKPLADESPAEKLDDSSGVPSVVPGAENPDSEEIKEEKGPNTE